MGTGSRRDCEKMDKVRSRQRSHIHRQVLNSLFDVLSMAWECTSFGMGPDSQGLHESGDAPVRICHLRCNGSDQPWPCDVLVASFPEEREAGVKVHCML